MGFQLLIPQSLPQAMFYWMEVIPKTYYVEYFWTNMLSTAVRKKSIQLKMQRIIYKTEILYPL